MCAAIVQLLLIVGEMCVQAARVVTGYTACVLEKCGFVDAHRHEMEQHTSGVLGSPSGLILQDSPLIKLSWNTDTLH